MCQHHRLTALGVLHAQHTHATEFALAGAMPHHAPDLALLPTHIALAASVDLEARTLAGHATLTVTAQRDGARQLSLHAVAFEEVSVTDGRGAPLVHAYDGQTLTVTLPDACQRGDMVSFTVAYKVVDPVTGLLFHRPDDPTAPRFAATDNETERCRYWLPTVDHPSVRPTLAFSIRAAAGLEVICNGALVETTQHGDETVTHHWRLDHPCPAYLTFLAVGAFVRLNQEDVDGVQIACFTTSQFDPTHLDRSFGRTPAIMRWLNQRLGVRYPYPKYFQVAVPGIGGAMENISAVSWDDRFVLDEGLAEDWGRLVDQINVHEMAHHWFGDLVVCRDFAHVWLKESWATFLEQVWTEEVLGTDDGHYEFYQNCASYFGEVAARYSRPMVTRTFNHSWQMYDMHLYPGGAARLHMLRALLGDTDFWRGVTLYLQRFANRTVETDDFRRTLEEVSGRSLTAFFDAFFFRSGFPALTVTFTHDAEAGHGVLTVQQEVVGGEKDAPPFSLQTAVAWTDDSGARHERAIELREARTVVHLPMAKPPATLDFDPHLAVMARVTSKLGTPLLRAALTTASTVVHRIRAACALLEEGRSTDIQTICDTWETQSFFGVRVELARALATCPNALAQTRLLGLLAGEKHPIVLEAGLRALIALRDPRAAAVAHAKLATGLTPRAAAAAWELVGASEVPAPVEVLAAQVDSAGFGGWAGAGAAAGLMRTRSPLAVEALLARTRALVHPDTVRPAVLRALGNAARLDQREAVRITAREALAHALQDPFGHVRRGALDGLSALGDPAGISAIERAGRAMAPQDAVGARAVVLGLHATNKDPHADNTRIEKLERELRELRERLDTFESREQRDGDR